MPPSISRKAVADAGLDLELGHDGRLRQAEELGDHGRHLAVVRADRLLSEEQEVGAGEAPLDDPGDDAGRPQAVVGLRRIVLDEEGLVGAHGQALAEDGDGLVLPDRNDPDDAALGLSDPEGLLDRVLVVGADDEVQPVLGDGRGPLGDADAGFRVGHPLDEGENVHRIFLLESRPVSPAGGLTAARTA